MLSEMLEKSGYINVLRTMQASISILAPSDEAFQKLPESRREKIINDREARLGKQINAYQIPCLKKLRSTNTCRYKNLRIIK